MQIITKEVRLVLGNPYVTDGLVAQFDGIWNAGLGRHDATLHEWTNLITGATTFSTGAPSFCSNGLNILPRGTVINLNSPEAVQAIQSGEFTIESIGSIEAFTGARFFWLTDRASGAADAIRFMTHNTNALFILSKLGNVADTVSHGRDSAPCGGYGNVIGHLSNHSEPNVTFYKNGSYYTRRTCTVSLTLQQLYIASAAGGPTGIYHALRIYNRPLTQAEAERNYEIDRIRFHF